MLKNCDQIIHLRFNFDACPMHSPFGFVHLTHQNFSTHALFCHNSLAKVNTQYLIYKYTILSKKLSFKLVYFLLSTLFTRSSVSYFYSTKRYWQYYVFVFPTVFPHSFQLTSPFPKQHTLLASLKFVCRCYKKTR